MVSGHKSFITNAGDADLYTVLCRERRSVLAGSGARRHAGDNRHPAAPDHRAARPRRRRVRRRHGCRPTTGSASRARGSALALATLATFRVSVAGAALGVAQAALDEALRHTTGRQPVRRARSPRLGPVPSLLALSWTEIEMARSLAYRAAAAAARDPRASLHLSSMAKVGATEVAGRVVDRAVQVMGRFGLVRGSVIERLYREARPMRIYEGATEVILDSLARQLVKRHGGRSGERG